MICPLCKNADKVYEQGFDPIEGPFVFCMVHGIQLSKVELVEQVPTAIPAECLECGAGCGKVERDICLSQWED